jgi:hypothetical protein
MNRDNSLVWMVLGVVIEDEFESETIIADGFESETLIEDRFESETVTEDGFEHAVGKPPLGFF